MRLFIAIFLLGVSLCAQQKPPNCAGVSLDVDIRCACVKDPNGQTCELYKRNKSMYDGEPLKPSPLAPYVNQGVTLGPNPSSAQIAPRTQSRPQKARVVALPSTDYLRFLHPNASLAAGIDFANVFNSPQMFGALLGVAGGDDERKQTLAALKEMDHFWISVASTADPVMLMTGRFEQGAAATLFYSHGIRPVFLGGAQAMMIGSESSIQAALARMAKPPANDGWVAQRARELARNHEAWIVTEPPALPADNASGALHAIRKFAFGIRIASPAELDGEAVADSEADAQKIAAWVDQIKALLREKSGAGLLDPLQVTLDGATLRFVANDDGAGHALLGGDAGKKALNSDLGPELYRLMTAGFPGNPPRTVAEDKIQQVHPGMKREEVLALLGAPQSVQSIQGLDEPRETFIYQVPFGKQYSIRLDAGVVSQPPR
jgi:hypothetical protein